MTDQMTTDMNRPAIISPADRPVACVQRRQVRPASFSSAASVQKNAQLGSWPRSASDSDIVVFPNGNWLGQNHNCIATQAEQSVRNNSSRHGVSVRHAWFSWCVFAIWSSAV